MNGNKFNSSFLFFLVISSISIREIIPAEYPIYRNYIVNRGNYGLNKLNYQESKRPEYPHYMYSHMQSPFENEKNYYNNHINYNSYGQYNYYNPLFPVVDNALERDELMKGSENQYKKSIITRRIGLAESGTEQNLVKKSQSTNIRGGNNNSQLYDSRELIDDIMLQEEMLKFQNSSSINQKLNYKFLQNKDLSIDDVSPKYLQSDNAIDNQPEQENNSENFKLKTTPKNGPYYSLANIVRISKFQNSGSISELYVDEDESECSRQLNPVMYTRQMYSDFILLTLKKPIEICRINLFLKKDLKINDFKIKILYSDDQSNWKLFMDRVDIKYGYELVPSKINLTEINEIKFLRIELDAAEIQDKHAIQLLDRNLVVNIYTKNAVDSKKQIGNVSNIIKSDKNRSEIEKSHANSNKTIVSRNQIQHPSDGRLLHFDNEVYSKVEEELIIMDKSIIATDALVKGNSTVSDEHWSCRHVVKFSHENDRILINPSNLLYRPKFKMTLMAYIKIEMTPDSVSPIFTVIGLHPEPHFFSLKLEITNDSSVHFYSFRKNGDHLLDVFTREGLIKKGQWHHIAVTFNCDVANLNSTSNIYVNGTLKASSDTGYGFIPEDWDMYIGIGNDNKRNQFYGSMDDFILFDRVLTEDEILKASRKCSSNKYYSGGDVFAKSGTILSPKYPEFYKDAMTAKWHIYADPDEIIAFKIEELIINGVNTCDRTVINFKEASTNQIFSSYCETQNSTIIKSTSNQVVINVESSGEDEGLKYRFRFKRVKSSKIKKSNISEKTPQTSVIINGTKNDKSSESLPVFDHSESCSIEKTATNIQIVNHTGFTRLGKFMDIFECSFRTCGRHKYDLVAFRKNNCYGVDCGGHYSKCMGREDKSSEKFAVNIMSRNDLL